MSDCNSEIIQPQPTQQNQAGYASGKYIIAASSHCIIDEPEGVESDSNRTLILNCKSHPPRHTHDRKRIITIVPAQADSLQANHHPQIYNILYIDPELIRKVTHDAGLNEEQPLIPSAFISNPELIDLVRLFIIECQHRRPGSDLMVQCLETQIALNILRANECTNSIVKRRNQPNEKQKVRLVIDYMHKHHREPLSLNQLSKTINYSTYHFIRVFKNETGKTPFEFLMDIRIEKALEMLKSENGNITEICYACGFNNPSHFSTVFKRKLGKTPSQFRKG